MVVRKVFANSQKTHSKKTIKKKPSLIITHKETKKSQNKTHKKINSCH